MKWTGRHVPALPQISPTGSNAGISKEDENPLPARGPPPSLVSFSSVKNHAQYGLKSGLCPFFPTLFFFLPPQSFGRHILQRVLLQYWQKLQSGQEFFFRILFSTDISVYHCCAVSIRKY
jgi:hypothetical protein